MRLLLVAPACCLLALSACGNQTPPVRYGPQLALPYTPGPNNVAATPGLQLAQSVDLEAVETALLENPEEFGAAVFPSAANNDVSRAIATFQSTCVAHTRDVTAIANTAARQGLDVERPAPDQVIGVLWTESEFVSLQVNIESSYAYECATTAVADQSLSSASVRDEFFRTLGMTHANGTSQLQIDGEAYQIRHFTVSGGALGINEHAFVLQAN